MERAAEGGDNGALGLPAGPPDPDLRAVARFRRERLLLGPNASHAVCAAVAESLRIGALPPGPLKDTAAQALSAAVESLSVEENAQMERARLRLQHQQLLACHADSNGLGLRTDLRDTRRPRLPGLQGVVKAFLTPGAFVAVVAAGACLAESV